MGKVNIMMPGVIVIGAGGHAKVCIELLLAMGEQVDYCIGTTHDSENCLDVPVLKGDDNLKLLFEAGYSRVFIAIGANHLREKLSIIAMQNGYSLVNAISPLACISPSVHLGQGIAIMAGAVINAQSSIADLVIINTLASIDHDCQVGKAAHIAPQCGLAGNVHIGKHSFLGIGSKVIPDVTIGDNVTIGAGAVVISDIPSDVTALGVPVRIIKELEHK